MLSIKEFDREFDLIEVKKHYVDYLGKVKIIDAEHRERELLVHLEFQSQNDPNMYWRMLEYAKEIYRKHGKYPFQVLIYMGERPLSMRACFKDGFANSFLHYCFEIIDLSSYQPKDFLEQEDPKIKLLAAFTLKANDPQAKPVLQEIVKSILVQASKVEQKHDLALLEFLTQQKHLFHTLKEVIQTFEVKIEDLPSYQEGLKEGAIKTILRLMKKKYQLSKTQEQHVKQLLQQHSLEKLNSITDLLITPITLEELLEKIK